MSAGSGEQPAVTAAATGNPAEPAPAEAQTPGALLSQARMRRGLSVQQAADALNLDVRIVQVLEANRFIELGAPVYAKGYLRKYAELLDLAPETVLARYRALADTPEEPTPVPLTTTTPPARLKWPKHFAWAVVAAIVLALGAGAFNALWPWIEARTDRSTAQDAAPADANAAAYGAMLESTETPAQAQPSASVEVPEHSRDSAPPGTPASEALASELTDAAPSQPLEETAVGSAPLQVRLTFTERSWVEIFDAAGQRLFYDVGQPGRTHTLSGLPPLKVVIGVASAVTLELDGRAIVVPRRANRDSTRFVINADGTVQ